MPHREHLEVIHLADRDPRLSMPYVPAVKVRSGKTVCVAGVTAAPIYHQHPHLATDFDAIPAAADAQARLAMDWLITDTLIAETGADLRRFPSPGHAAKWAGGCHGSHESAGKRRRVGVAPGHRWRRRARGAAPSAPTAASSPSGEARTRPPSPWPTA